MNKAIIILTGSSTGRAKFNEIAKRTCWLWSINPKNYLTNTAKNLYWNGDRDNNFYGFISGLLESSNSAFNFEENYIAEKLEKFHQDADDYKRNENNITFSKFLLVIEGVSNKLIKKLEDEEGAFQLHIAQSQNTNIEKHDYTVFETSNTFCEDVERVINVLTNEKEKV